MSANNPETTEARKPRILVAEDNEANQLVARITFRKLRCEATIVGNGEEAVAAASKEPFDMIFMDCSMPVLDGYEATRKIRGMNGGLQDVPIIAMTARSMSGDREACLEAGMTDYVAKPVEREDLQRILKEYLGYSAPG